MRKIKLESVNSSTFMVSGVAYLKGQYKVEYVETTNTTLGVVSDATKAKVLIKPLTYNGLDKHTLYPFKEARPYTDFVDSTGTAYADFDTFTKALTTLIAGANATTTNDLFSDKAQVTQGTSKTTTVVSNTLSTTITTVALTDALDTAFSFTFTNSKISATSIVLPSVNMNAGTGKAIITVVPNSGSATITVSNVGVASFNSAIKIGLVVI